LKQHQNQFRGLGGESKIWHLHWLQCFDAVGWASGRVSGL